jgi:hypothetical protein
MRASGFFMILPLDKPLTGLDEAFEPIPASLLCSQKRAAYRKSESGGIQFPDFCHRLALPAALLFDPSP